LGPEAVPTWADSLRTITGVDERKLGDWLADSGKATGAALVWGAGKAGEAGKAAGGAVMTGAGKVAETVGPALSSGAKKAGETAQKGGKAYIRSYVNTWKTIFGFVGRILGFIWTVIAFIPRKIAGLFKGKEKTIERQD